MKSRDLPSGYVNSLLLKMAIEIVDLPIKHGDFPISYVKLPEDLPPQIRDDWTKRDGLKFWCTFLQNPCCQ